MWLLESGGTLCDATGKDKKINKKIEITNYKAIGKGALVAFFDCEIVQTSMQLYGCKLFEKDNRRWIGLPTRETVDDNRTKKYYPVVSFRDKAILQRFNNAVIEAIGDHLKTEQPAADDDFSEIPF